MPNRAPVVHRLPPAGLPTLGVVLSLLAAGAGAEQPSPQPDNAPAPAAYVTTRTLPAAGATQAAAADERHVYAVSSTNVTQYDRKSGEEVARSTGEATHLNSAFVWEGKVYCAHSNYPKTPDESDIRVLDPATMKLTVFHKFERPAGSLTWVIRRKGEDGWWCHFARYGKENAKSILIRYDEQWKETARWTYPAELVAEWGTYSLSGAVWSGQTLVGTGHDKRLVYRMKIPKDGATVEYLGAVPSPFPGQGIALDTDGSTLIGIDRGKKQVIFAAPKPAK